MPIVAVPDLTVRSRFKVSLPAVEVLGNNGVTVDAYGALFSLEALKAR